MSDLAKTNKLPDFDIKRVGKWTYDFSVHGGSTGDINTGIYIPDGAVVLRAFLIKETAFTSGDSATVALNMVSSEDILSATAIASLASTLNACTPDDTLTNAVVNSSGEDKRITMTVGTADLTAGKYEVVVEYIV